MHDDLLISLNNKLSRKSHTKKHQGTIICVEQKNETTCI